MVQPLSFQSRSEVSLSIDLEFVYIKEGVMQFRF